MLKNNFAGAQHGAHEVDDFQTANKVSVVRPRKLNAIRLALAHKGIRLHNAVHL